jgi:hypothetical protein
MDQQGGQQRQDRSGEPWSEDDLQQLRELAQGNTPTGLIAHKLGRTEAAVQSKAVDEGISLSPPNRSPYGTVE